LTQGVDLIHKTLRKALQTSQRRMPLDVASGMFDAVLRLLILEYLTVDGGLDTTASTSAGLTQILAVGEEAVQRLVHVSRPGEAVRMERALRRLLTAFHQCHSGAEKESFRDMAERHVSVTAEALIDALADSPHLAVIENMLKPARQEKLAAGSFQPWPLPLASLQKAAVKRILAPFTSAHEHAVKGVASTPHTSLLANKAGDEGDAAECGGSLEEPEDGRSMPRLPGPESLADSDPQDDTEGVDNNNFRDVNDDADGGEDDAQTAANKDEENVGAEDEDVDEDEDDDGRPAIDQSQTRPLHRVPVTAVLKLCDQWNFQLSPDEVELMELAYLAEMLEHDELIEAAEYADGNCNLEQALVNLSGCSVAALIQARLLKARQAFHNYGEMLRSRLSTVVDGQPSAAKLTFCAPATHRRATFVRRRPGKAACKCPKA
jgi:hypothetical protein